MKKILFLGYNSKQTRLINFLRKKNKVTEHGQKKVTIRIAKYYDFLISFGYKKVLSKKIIQSLKRPAVNLHISYLPYNKGAHPNFWSFIDNTPKGVSIHEINEKIDDGKIIIRKKLNFILTKNTTFEETHKKLIIEIEKLFIKNSKNILIGKYKGKKIIKKGTFHKKKNLPKNIVKWNIKILSYLQSLK